eukprot:ANDGO_05063.mRNA.1 hypothetical protein
MLDWRVQYEYVDGRTVIEGLVGGVHPLRIVWSEAPLARSVHACPFLRSALIPTSPQTTASGPWDSFSTHDMRTPHPNRIPLSIIEKRLRTAPSLETFVEELLAILSRLFPGYGVSAAPATDRAVSLSHASASFLRELFAEIESIGWNRVSFLSPDLSRLQLDDGALSISLPSFACSFAVPFLPPHMTSIDCAFSSSDAQPSRLRLRHLLGKLSDLQELARPVKLEWDDLVEHFSAPVYRIIPSESRLLILDPVAANIGVEAKQASSVSGSVSVVLDVNPQHPRDVPGFRFFGSESLTRPLRLRLAKNLAPLWHDADPLWKNISKIMELSPCVRRTSQMTSAASSGGGALIDEEKEGEETECGICYGAAHAGGLGPLRQECSTCKKRFHSLCITECLRAMPSGRISWDNMLLGECPYCGSAIAVQTDSAA